MLSLLHPQLTLSSPSGPVGVGGAPPLASLGLLLAPSPYHCWFLFGYQ